MLLTSHHVTHITSCYSNNLPQYLVDEHAGEDADEDADDGEPEHSPEAGVDGPVDDLAVGGCSEHITQGGCNVKCSVTLSELRQTALS